MICSALMSEAAAWIGGFFDGDRCEQCGRVEVLRPFRINIKLGEKRIVREAKLCRRCMDKVELCILSLPENSRVH